MVCRRTAGDWKNEPCDTQGLNFICSRKFDCENRGGRPVEGSKKCFRTPNSTSASFADAHAQCKEDEMELASVTSENENSVINLMITELGHSSAWIGLADVKEEGRFTWVDGEMANYSNFAAGAPDNWQNSQHCVRMFSGSQPAGSDRCVCSDEHGFDGLARLLMGDLDFIAESEESGMTGCATLKVPAQTSNRHPSSSCQNKT